MRSVISMTAVALALGWAFSTTPAWAKEGKVDLTADVVLVSNQGNSVEPGLEGMKDRFAKEHFNFTFYKRLSSEKVSLDTRKARDIKLPNGQTAQLKMLDEQKGAATVEVSIGGGTAVKYTLGREGSVFVNTGHLQDGEVFLVLSPASSGK